MPLPQLVFSCLILVVVVADVVVGGTNYASSAEQTRQEHAERLAGAEAGSDCAGAECGGIASPTYVAYPILFLFVSLLIGCAVRFTLESVKSKFNFNVPYSVVLLIFGGILGGVSWLQQRESPANDRWTISLTIWTQMSPRLILFIFLPALIFEGAMSTDFYVFKQQLPGALMLAFPAMLLQVVLIALVGMITFPYNWGWVESLMFGAILSATDPVAVIALMKVLIC